MIPLTYSIELIDWFRTYPHWLSLFQVKALEGFVTS